MDYFRARLDKKAQLKMLPCLQFKAHVKIVCMAYSTQSTSEFSQLSDEIETIPNFAEILLLGSSSLRQQLSYASKNRSPNLFSRHRFFPTKTLLKSLFAAFKSPVTV